MLLRNLLASSALVFGVFAAPAGHVTFHVTDLVISGNPNDDLPQISFHVSGENPNRPARSFAKTECKVPMTWGSNKENNTLAPTKVHKCENEHVHFRFGINWFFTGYDLYRDGYYFDITQHFPHQ
jgi:hypothetical protein